MCIRDRGKVKDESAYFDIRRGGNAQVFDGRSCFKGNIRCRCLVTIIEDILLRFQGSGDVYKRQMLMRKYLLFMAQRISKTEHWQIPLNHRI